LSISDDGPGASGSDDATSSGQKLGMQILQGLSNHIHGTLTITAGKGRQVTVEFPTLRSASKRKS
jgi:two-component sensor histidine kinase